MGTIYIHNGDEKLAVAIYENGIAASSGVESLVVYEKDVFEFKVECWNTLDSGYGLFDKYDILVDKAIYHYAKT